MLYLSRRISETFYFLWFTLHTGSQRKRFTIGEHEKRFIVECYNLCHGEDWKDVFLFAKSRIIEVGLPDHVVHIYLYLEQSTERLTGRMRNENCSAIVSTRCHPVRNFNRYRRNSCVDSQANVNKVFQADDAKLTQSRGC